MTSLFDKMKGNDVVWLNFCSNICPIQEKSVISQRFSKKEELNLFK